MSTPISVSGYKVSPLFERQKKVDSSSIQEKNVKNRQKKNTEKVVVVGLGYVGLPLSLLAASSGYFVAGIDIDVNKIGQLKKKQSPFEDEDIEIALKKSKASFSNSFDLVSGASIVIVCVPTPVFDDHSPNLEPLIEATRSLAPKITKGTLVIIESTVNPGVCEDIVLPLLIEGSGMSIGEFHLAHCPERINPGDKVWGIKSIPRVVGSSDPEGLRRAVAFYESILSASVYPMNSIKEAEAVKVVENSFRDVNIAFVNELAMSFEKLGIDVVNVLRGASTKPFSFMAHFPGCGVGGHCIPVDPYYLISYGKQNGFNHEFLSMARKINNHMPNFTVDLLARLLRNQGKSIAGSKVAVLGLSYKPNVDDTRESPSFKIIQRLKAMGAHPVAFDPHAIQLSDVKTIDEALVGAEGVIVATAHKEFTELEPQFFKAAAVTTIVDGRNCLDKEAFRSEGIAYVGIGR